MNHAITQAISETLTRPDLWLIVFASAVYGVFVGAIPGLTATMAVALFVPMAYWMEPVDAIAAIVTMVACAIFAGDLPTALLRIPGTPASAAYADDAYALSRRGLARRLLMVSLFRSAFGGIFGAVVLMLLGGQLASFARSFSVAEYFWLYLIGLSCAVLVAPATSRWQAVCSLLIGWLLSAVGISAAHPEPRLTFGITALYQGISFIPAMIGLFGLSEVFANLSEETLAGRKRDDDGETTVSNGDSVGVTSRRKSRAIGFTRSGSIGVLIGMLPGAGADIAAWVAYAMAKRKSSAADGEATIDTIGEASTANSAALAGGWIPMLVFGIPGDSVTAIVIGVLLMKNVTPGPAIFEDQPVLVYSIYLTFILANLLMVPVGLAAISLASRMVQLSKRMLLPLIVLFCVTGAYSLNGSLFDVATMLAMGLLGFGLSRFRFPLGPVVLGLILGGPLEERLMQALTASGGSPIGLVNRPVSVLLAFVTGVIFWGILRAAWRDRRH